MNLQRIQHLAGIKLNESVMAVPGLGESAIEEKAPPGMEDTVMKLKKEYPGEEEKAFATAWSIYNKKHGKTEESVNTEVEEAYGDFRQHYQDANKPSTFVPSREQKPNQAAWGDHPIMAATDRIHDTISNALAKRKAKKERGMNEEYNENLEECFTGDKETDDIVSNILTAASDNHMDMDDALVKVSDFLLGQGYNNDEVLGIMSNVENYLHDESMRSDMGAAPDEIIDYSDDEEPDEVIGMDSPTDWDEHEMNADDSVDEGVGVDDLFLEDLDNGYKNIKKAHGSDYFPDGAESSVVKTVGPSGAKQGDNPEQKKMQVAEVHKELVYGYREYLKESNGNSLENLNRTMKVAADNISGYIKTKC